MVDIYISSQLSNAIIGTDYSDDLQGSKVGCHFGSINAGNSREKTVAIAHNHTEQTLDASIYFTPIVVGAGETYAGTNNPTLDFNKLLTWGDAGEGLGVEFDWTASAYVDLLKTGIMDSLAHAEQIPADSMAYDVVGVTTAPSAPIAGEIYPIGDASKATYGEGAVIKTQLSIPSTETQSREMEWDMVVVLEIVA